MAHEDRGGTSWERRKQRLRLDTNDLLPALDLLPEGIESQLITNVVQQTLASLAALYKGRQRVLRCNAKGALRTHSGSDAYEVNSGTAADSASAVIALGIEASSLHVVAESAGLDIRLYSGDTALGGWIYVPSGTVLGFDLICDGIAVQNHTAGSNADYHVTAMD